MQEATEVYKRIIDKALELSGRPIDEIEAEASELVLTFYRAQGQMHEHEQRSAQTVLIVLGNSINAHKQAWSEVRRAGETVKEVIHAVSEAAAMLVDVQEEIDLPRIGPADYVRYMKSTEPYKSWDDGRLRRFTDKYVRNTDGTKHKRGTIDQYLHDVHKGDHTPDELEGARWDNYRAAVTQFECELERLYEATPVLDLDRALDLLNNHGLPNRPKKS